MELFVGLDVSVRTTSVCVMDTGGKLIRESKVETEPEAVGALLHAIGAPTSASALKPVRFRNGSTVACRPQAIQQDRSQRCPRHRADDARRPLQAGSCQDRPEPGDPDAARCAQVRADEDSRCGEQPAWPGAQLWPQGRSRTRLQFERRIIELLEQSPHLHLVIDPLLEVRRVLREQFQRLHKAMERLAESDDTYKLLVTAPGVGPMVALSFRAGVDEPARFSRSRSVPAHFGLTPSRYQSGEIDQDRGISKCGDAGIRWVSVEAAGILLRISKRSSPLKAWGPSVARRRGKAKGYSGGVAASGDHPASDVGRQHTLSLGGQCSLKDRIKGSASPRG